MTFVSKVSWGEEDERRVEGEWPIKSSARYPYNNNENEIHIQIAISNSLITANCMRTPKMSPIWIVVGCSRVGGWFKAGDPDSVHLVHGQ